MKRLVLVAITLLAAASIFILGQSCASPTRANTETRRFTYAATGVPNVNLITDTKTGRQYLVNGNGGFVELAR